jgi:NAD(P)-dependent dehydrogenase (short-subunit alcohol dehydrogenase family)
MDQFFKALLEHHAKVYMASRNQQKAEAAIEELYESTGKRAVFLHLDLSDLLSVKRAAMEFLRYLHH